MTMTHAGLFEGYGGTTMGAALALGPLDTRWVSDIKPASVALLAHRHPGLLNLGDMTTIDYTAAEPVDVLTASWPCQPHSSAGKRLGEADHRALWPHVARALGELRPRIFLGENVARIATNGELRRVVRSLAELGYVGAWRCVNASDIGAPHKRARCFVAAVRADVAADTLAGGWSRQSSGTEPHRDASVRGETLDLTRDGNRLPLTLLPTPTQSMTTGAGTSGRDGGLNLQTAVTLLPTPKASDGEKGGPGMRGSSGDLAMPSAAVLMQGGRWGRYAAAIEQWEHVLGRAAPEPTQPSPRADRPQLAPAFVEWMMGVPAGWVSECPGLVDSPRRSERNARLSLLGDGVVPQQAAYAFRLMLGELLTGRMAA